MSDYAGRTFFDKAERVAATFAGEWFLEEAGHEKDLDELPAYHDMIAHLANVLRRDCPELGT